MGTLKDYENFKGPDADLATSLYEYGLIWKELDQDDDTLFVYGVEYDKTKSEYIRFDHAWIDPKTFFQDYDWADWGDLAKTLDISIKHLKEFPIVELVSYLVGFYGSTEIFGDSYHKGYKIPETEE